MTKSKSKSKKSDKGKESGSSSNANDSKVSSTHENWVELVEIVSVESRHIGCVNRENVPCRIGNKSSTFGWKMMNKEFIRKFKVHPYTQSNFIFFGYEPRSNISLRCSQNPFPLNISISLYSNINPDIYPKQEGKVSQDK